MAKVNLTGTSFLYASYDPLSLGFVLKEIGGSVKQVQYADADGVSFSPNRKLVPLVLLPEIQIVDPDRILASEDVASQLVSARWYVGSVSEVTQVVLYEDETGGSTADYALSRTYKSGLIIRKNVEPTKPVSLFFIGEYYDSRRGSNVQVNMGSLLTTTSNSEEEAAPAVVISTPALWSYDPLKGMFDQTIQAYLFKNGVQVTDKNAAYFWHKVENGVSTEIDPESDYFYVSGKNADGTWKSSLVVNPEFMEKVQFVCYAEYYTDTRPAAPSLKHKAESIFKRRFPYSLKAESLIHTGELVKASVKKIKCECVVTTNAGKVANPDEFFFIQWYANAMTSGAKDVELGHGSIIEADRDLVMGSNSAVRPKIFFNLSDHGPYKGLTDNDGNVLTDNDGNVLVGF